MDKGIIQKTGTFYDFWWASPNLNLSSNINNFLKRVDKNKDYFKNKRCLDAGCGYGRVLYPLLVCGAKEVVGTDIGEMKIAQQLCKGYKNIKFMNVPIAEIPTTNNYFDFVHCSGVLHHTQNPEENFKKLVNLTKGGGELYIAVYGKYGLLNLIFFLLRPITTRCQKEFLMTLMQLFFGKSKAGIYYDHFGVPIRKTYTEKEVKKWFKENGFKNIKRLNTAKHDYTKIKNKLLHGYGWIQIIGVKD